MELVYGNTTRSTPIRRRKRVSIISNQQKGLVDSLNTVLPNAKHQKCARHVFANWKIKHKHTNSRKAFWNAVYACNEAEWTKHVDKLRELERSCEAPGAYSDFISVDPKSFCRAFVSRAAKCDSIQSIICETFMDA